MIWSSFYGRSISATLSYFSREMVFSFDHVIPPAISWVESFPFHYLELFFPWERRREKKSQSPNPPQQIISSPSQNLSLFAPGQMCLPTLELSPLPRTTTTSYSPPPRPRIITLVPGPPPPRPRRCSLPSGYVLVRIRTPQLDFGDSAVGKLRRCGDERSGSEDGGWGEEEIGEGWRWGVVRRRVWVLGRERGRGRSEERRFDLNGRDI